jgi:integrase/recombinase XerD
MKQAKLLNDVEFKRLTATINSLRYATRNHTVVALSFYGGLRAVEISNILVKDIVDEFGEVKDTAYLSAQQTKGADGCTVYINEKLRKQIKKYITAHPTLLKNRNRKLIFSAKGLGFTAQTIVNLFQRLYKLASIEGASSHSGRRQFVTSIADKGINARIVQQLARHKHLSTTQIYIELNPSKLRNAVELV